MQTNVHKRIRIGFFIAFTIIVIASALSFLIAKNLMRNANLLNHAVVVSKKLEVMTRQLKEAEAAIRGYNLTNDTSFLRPSMEERSVRIELEYRNLRKMTEDPVQLRNLDTLKQLLDIKYKQLSAGVKVQTPHRDSISVNEGEVSMERIDKQVRKMMRIEDTQLSEKSRLFEFFSNLWIPMLFILSLLAIFIGIYSYIVLNREFRLQMTIESRMRSYQRELQENIQLLNKSNKELEQFAYVASHDLQEPLRKISTFSDRLQSKYRQDLTDDAAELLDRMTSAVGRMRVLVNDLLIFSRAGRIAPESIVPVDMNALIGDVIGDLELALQEKSGRIVYGDMPVIEGMDTGLHQLFQNLLSNSIKFAHPGRPLEIDILPEVLSGREAGFASDNKRQQQYCRITITDNGIGFEPSNAERIFLIFQRLHGVSEYKGTGIGLAICQKIVDAHQGTIQASGEPGKGATFTIILPLKQLREE